MTSHPFFTSFHDIPLILFDSLTERDVFGRQVNMFIIFVLIDLLCPVFVLHTSDQAGQ